MKSSFAHNLQRARLHRRYSMEELADQVGCSKQAISHYENGNRFPDGKTLRALAHSLKTEVESLLSPIMVQFALLDVNYRAGLELTTDERSEIEEFAGRRLVNYLEVEQLAKESVKFENPISDLLVADTFDAEKAAKVLRKRWKLGDGPIPSVTKLLEDKGIRVLKVNFGEAHQHEGLSGWAENNSIPVIVINERQKELTRVRYTLLHELGHLLLMLKKGLDIEEIENICEAFAGSVLIPTDILKIEFGRNRTSILMPELRRIKEFYGISILAIMVRARFANLISFETFAKWKLSKFSRGEHGEYLGKEKPERFNQLLLKCLGEGRIGVEKASRLAGKSQEDFQEIYDTLFSFDV